MKVWDIVALVLGSNFIMALVTYLTTRMQINNSAIQFKLELEKTREEARQNRRWEVRSEPLKKLRNELGNMSYLLNRIVGAKESISISSGIVPEKTKRISDELNREYNDHCIPELYKTLFTQSDPELFNKVQEIQNRYKELMDLFDKNKEIELAEDKIWPRVLEAQELINKKLEAL